MAERRNAELHSGETPLTGVDERTWVPSLWRIVDVLIAQQSRALADFIGDEEAQRVREILRSAAELTRQTVLARIARRTAEMRERFVPGSTEWAEVEQRANARSLPARFHDAADAFEDAPCPACGMKGWLFGALEREEYLEIDGEVDPEWGRLPREVLEVTYSSERYVCSECGLILDGRDELAIADLQPEFVQEEEHEPDYEPDYGMTRAHSSNRRTESG